MDSSPVFIELACCFAGLTDLPSVPSKVFLACCLLLLPGPARGLRLRRALLDSPVSLRRSGDCLWPKLLLLVRLGDRTCAPPRLFELEVCTLHDMMLVSSDSIVEIDSEDLDCTIFDPTCVMLLLLVRLRDLLGERLLDLDTGLAE